MYTRDIRPKLPADILWLIPGDVHVDTRATRVSVLYALVRDLVVKSRLRGIVFQGDTFDKPNSKVPREFLTFLVWLHEQGVRIVMLPGNHDPNIEALLTASATENQLTLPPIEFPGAQFTFEVADRKYLVLHGDVFDDYIQKRKRTSLLATWLYEKIQAIDSEEQKTSRKIKKWTKKLLRLGKVLGERAMAHGYVHGAKVVVCGHVHIATHMKRKTDNGRIHYVNVGCFTSAESYFATIRKDGRFRIHRVIIKRNK